MTVLTTQTPLPNVAILSINPSYLLYNYVMVLDPNTNIVYTTNGNANGNNVFIVGAYQKDMFANSISVGNVYINTTALYVNGSPITQGFTGSLGFTGSRGNFGFTGSQGSQGFTGSQGAGFTGSRGPPGSTGVTGFTGSQGAGFTGSQGDPSGVPGDPGPQGYTGSPGRNANTAGGFTGSQGDLGFTGSQGFVGSKGNQGNQGNQGFTGSQGVQGWVGFTGSIGFTGSPGAATANGPFTFATLPVSPGVFNLYWITDAPLGLSWGDPITGGGFTGAYLVTWNASHWTVVAK